MTRALLPAVALMFAVGCNATVSGTLVDGLNGSPIAGKAADAGEDVQPLRVVAKSTYYAKTGEDNMPHEVPTDDPDGSWQDNASAGLTCMSFSADVATDGSFALSGLCTGSTAYNLELSDKNWFLGETSKLEKGHDASQPLTLKAWRAPMGTAVNILGADNELSPVRTRQNVKSETIKGTDGEKVFYPEGLPKQTPLIEKGQYLVISGANYKDLKLVPMVNSGKREFKVEEGMESGPTMNAWTYLGTSFTDDSTFERVTAKIDESKVTTVEHDGHMAKFIPADAVSPQGRYALWQDGKDNAFIVDIGKAGEAPVAAPEE